MDHGLVDTKILNMNMGTSPVEHVKARLPKQFAEQCPHLSWAQEISSMNYYDKSSSDKKALQQLR